MLACMLTPQNPYLSNIYCIFPYLLIHSPSLHFVDFEGSLMRPKRGALGDGCSLLPFLSNSHCTLGDLNEPHGLCTICLLHSSFCAASLRINYDFFFLSLTMLSDATEAISNSSVILWVFRMNTSLYISKCGSAGVHSCEILNSRTQLNIVVLTTL